MTTPRRALVVVDVQQEYFDGPLEVQFPPRDESVAKVVEAVDVATAAGLPIAVFQHTGAEGDPVFDPTTAGHALHPSLEQRRTPEWASFGKQYGTVFAGSDLLAWLRHHDVDTVTYVGYMTNNCILASAAESETHGLAAEVLSDATGAIHLANAAGSVSARDVHTTLMTLLHSNFAAVATTRTWADAVTAGSALDADNLVESAVRGAQRAG